MSSSAFFTRCGTVKLLAKSTLPGKAGIQNKLGALRQQDSVSEDPHERRLSELLQKENGRSVVGAKECVRFFRSLRIVYGLCNFKKYLTAQKFKWDAIKVKENNLLIWSLYIQ